MAGVISVVVMILGASFPLFAASKLVEVAAVCGFILAAYGVWAKERDGRVDEHEGRLEAQRIIDFKRARIEPELVYAEDPPGYRNTVTLYCTNVGEWAAREVLIEMLGNTRSPMTFEVIQLLLGNGTRVAARPFFTGQSRSIGETLGDLALAQYVVAQMRAAENGLPAPPRVDDIALLLNYVDTQTGTKISDTFVFESIDPVSGISLDHRWVVRRRAVTPV
ncbi:MAG TPA: hypothetical protein VNN08_25500 [Thermoanaerobaculia bacterium]|nr:hypothetical protein [Thermoanaerobaculia bacterium]